MKRFAGFALGLALLLAGSTAGAAGIPMMPMSPGFAERLQCSRGSVAVDVTRADPRVAPRAVVVTTTIAIGSVATKTRSVRTVDGQGNIYSLGYVAGDALKAFPKRLLLPASPPAAGAHSSYFNVSGIVIAKHFEGTKATQDARGRPLTGYVFSDYLSGRKLNAVTYVPSIGIAEARFFGMLPDGSDLTCRLG